MLHLLYALLATARSSLKPQRELALQNLALRQQLAILQRKTKRPKLTKAERYLFHLSRVHGRTRFARPRRPRVICVPSCMTISRKPGCGEIPMLDRILARLMHVPLTHGRDDTPLRLGSRFWHTEARRHSRGGRRQGSQPR